MNLFKLGIITIILSFLLGCQSSTGLKINGVSNTDSTLKNKTLNMVKLVINAKGCSNIERIDIKVILHEPKNGKKNHIWGKEEWVAKACSKTFPFALTFTEDGNNGTYSDMKVE